LSEFTLHERLASDTVPVADGPLSVILLMNERTYPWLILVPRRSDLREMHDLTATDQAQLMVEITTASQCLESLFAADKINVGALGNLVPQLHIHVIARFSTDPAWPGPVWGVAPPEPYDPGGLANQVETLRNAFHQEF